MKVLQEGNPNGWEIERKCTGQGNGGGGCGRRLIVIGNDIFVTTDTSYGENYYYYTSKCPYCGIYTDIPEKEIPLVFKEKAMKEYKRIQEKEEKKFRENNEKIFEIKKCLGKITDITPEVRVRTQNDSSIFIICFEGKIPDEACSKEIENALKEYGVPVSNHCRDASFVSFSVYQQTTEQ